MLKTFIKILLTLHPFPFKEKGNDSMIYQINGLKDIHKLLIIERKVCGVIEVDSLRSIKNRI
jgi:hypothetical protein